MSADQFTLVEEGSGEEKRHRGQPMDPDLAQLWATGKFVSTAGRPGSAALIVAASLEPDRSSFPTWLHMQKALLHMNVQLSQAVSDVTGVTGQAIIRAILSGVCDPQALASLREPGCKKSEEEIGKALTGTWREERLVCV